MRYLFCILGIFLSGTFFSIFFLKCKHFKNIPIKNIPITINRKKCIDALTIRQYISAGVLLVNIANIFTVDYMLQFLPPAITLIVIGFLIASFDNESIGHTGEDKFKQSMIWKELQDKNFIEEQKAFEQEKNKKNKESR